MSFFSVPHQYVDRQSGEVITESLLGDRMVAFLYSRMRERVPAIFNALISARLTSVLGHLRYDGCFDGHQIDSRKMAARLGIR
jgi:phosphatidylserine decarboxylase